MEQKRHETEGSEGLIEFLKVTLKLPEGHLRAVDGLAPMTQEIFDDCLDECVGLGAQRQFRELVDRFPGLYREYADRLDSDADPLPAQVLQTDAVWRRVQAQLARMEKEGKISE